MKIAPLILMFGLLVPARPLAGQQAELKFQDSFDRIDRLTAQWVLPAADSLCRVLADSVSGSCGPRSFEMTELLLRRLRIARAAGDSTAGAQARTLLELRRAALPGQDPRLVPALIEAAGVATRAGDFERSHALLNECMVLLRGASPPDSQRLAAVHQEMGLLELQGHNAAAAESEVEQAYRLRRRVLGEHHRDTAWSRLFRGIARMESGRLVAARGDYEAALASLRVAVGDRHRDYLWALNSYATFLQWKRDFAPAREAYESILRIRREAGTYRTAENGWTLYNLAVLAQEMTDYPRAESLYAESCYIRRAVLGPDFYTAQSLTGCATMQLLRGDYAGARQRLDEALGIFSDRGRSGDAEAAFCLMQRALVHYWTGDTDAARDDYEHARTVMLVKGRPEDRMTCLAGLGLCLMAEGRAVDAEASYREALRIADAAFGASSHGAGQAHISLAQALSRQHRYVEAEAEFAAGLRAIERSPAPRDYFLGSALFDYGRDQLERGYWHSAHRALGRSARLMASFLEPSHPHMVHCWSEMAWAARGMDQPGTALRLALKAQELEARHYRTNLPFMAERHALLYRDAFESAASTAVGVLAATPRPTPADLAQVWSAAINSRMLVLDRSVARVRALRGPRGAGEAEFRAFAAASRRLGNLYARGMGQVDAAYLQLLRQAVAERDATERAWAVASFEGQSPPGASVTLSSILRRVPVGNLLVGYVRYPTSPRADGPRRAYAYRAFVGRSTGVPASIPLGDAGAIDRLVHEWQELMRQASGDLRLAPEQARQRYAATADSLRQLIWDPLRPHLGGINQVLVVPDGAIHLVSLGTLPTEDGGYLVDQPFSIRVLTAERDLVEPPAPPGRGLLALGDPDYGAPDGFALASRPVDSRVPPRDLRRGRTDCAGLEEIAFERLPATGAEVDSLGRLWTQTHPAVPAELFRRGEATEQVVRERGPGRRVLHLATHGFAPDPACGPGPLDNFRSGSEALGLRSGLAFAGVNGGLSGSADDDGLLTADEIRSLNLSGVELVVLSACNSGGGLPVASEGLVGLRRAFQAAGVRNLVVSLWPVGDEATRAWMEAFYRHLWAAGREPADAALRASRFLLAERRRAGRSTHPFYWGGFVAIAGGP